MRRQEEMARQMAMATPPRQSPEEREQAALQQEEEGMVNGEKEETEEQAEAKNSGKSSRETKSLPGTPMMDKDKKKRSRSKSPFRSFRWPKRKSGDDVDSTERLSPGPDDEQTEGLLVRKHEWESTTKKASNRSWDKVYVVLQNNLLLVYKDQKHCKQEPENYYRSETPSDLKGGSAEVATDYTKKKHVFRVKIATGGEFLFQAKDDEEMMMWLTRITAATSEGGSAGPSRAQTLPASSEGDKDKKKGGFFTMKKK
jgi:spectrin beta